MCNEAKTVRGFTHLSDMARKGGVCEVTMTAKPTQVENC